jgi:2'-phosphotransferase
MTCTCVRQLTVHTPPQPMALHGTYLAAWQTIATDGLSRMKRNHIHLASGERCPRLP